MKDEAVPTLNKAALYKGVLRVEAQLHALTSVLRGKEPTSIGQEDRVGSLPAFILWRGVGDFYFYWEPNPDLSHL